MRQDDAIKTVPFQLNLVCGSVCLNLIGEHTVREISGTFYIDEKLWPRLEYTVSTAWKGDQINSNF